MEGDHSLKRHERLKGTLRFKIIKARHRPVKGKLLLVRISPNGLNVNRVGISISSRAYPKSTKRNRAKRLIREAYRLHKPEIKKGFDVVIRAKGEEALSFREVESDLLKIFQRGNILR